MRFYNVTPTLPPNGLTVAELFCGGGLMAVGLKESGFSIVWANDFDKSAVEAYRYNIGDHVVLGDITKIDPDDIPDVDVIAGGPPCQDFSQAGKHEGEKGERGKLVWTYLNIIKRKKPKSFLFENVKGLISKKHRHTFDALLEKFDEIGYNVSWKLINSWDYGVAQKRERVFIVGIRKDLGFFFEFPEPDPKDYRTQVLQDVIGDLPDPTKQVNGGHLGISENILKHNERNKAKGNGFCLVPQKWDKPCGTITASQGCIGSIYPLEPQNHVDYPLTDGSYEHAKRKNIGYNTSLEQPGKTVRASSEQVLDIQNQHPRRFTVRECLRIQAVPDWYVLPDDISLSAQYRIVGNGVPSRVAWYLGKALAEQLNIVEIEQEAEYIEMRVGA